MDYFLYALEHTYIDETHRDSKFLGYFDVREAKEKALALPGFSKYPDGIVVKKFKLDKINWENGFESIIGEA